MEWKLIALLGLGCCAVSGAALARDPKPSPGHWPDGVYTWSYNPTGAPAWLSADESRRLVQQAAKRWQICGVQMRFAGETTAVAGRIDGANVIGWSNGLKPGIRGVTLGQAKNGNLLERDIVFAANREELQRSPRLLSKVLTHEFGHTIGLTHSAECGDVMTLAADCPGLDPDALPLEPTANDRKRCEALYRP